MSFKQGGRNKNLSSFLIAKKQEENKNEQNTGTKTIKKIGKATFEVVIHFNENTKDTMQDKLKRIMLRAMEREKHKKAIKIIRNSLTSCYW